MSKTPVRYYSTAIDKETREGFVTIFGDITAWPWLEGDVSSYRLASVLQQMDVDTLHVHIKGVMEGSVQHQTIIDTYNTYTPRPRGYKVTYTDSWCAAFVSAIAIKAGLTAIMPVECSCGEMIKLYKAKGRWMENDDYVPSPGDLILYDWQDSGKGDCTGAPDHVGIVEAVTNGKTITVIEGNYQDMVRRRVLAVDSRSIRGYCCPDYAAAATKSPEEITVANAVSDGVVTMPDYWLAVLRGQQTASAANVKALMDKYHAALGRR